MNPFLKWPYKILRTLLMVLVVLFFAVPAGLYVALSLPSVQRSIAHVAEDELSRLLTVPVTIEGLSITPFNRVQLSGVAIEDTTGYRAIDINRLSAGISLWDYLSRGSIIITFAEIQGLDARLTKATPDAPLNIQPIIDALKPKDKNKPPTKFDIKVNTVVIRSSSVTFDILSAPVDSSRFNPSHIAVSNLQADVVLPRLRNDDFIIDLRRMSLTERSGLKLTNLRAKAHITPSRISVSSPTLDLASTHLALADIDLPINGYGDLKNLWKERPIDIDILKGSFIGSADAAVFLPQLKGLDLILYTELRAQASEESIHIARLDFNTSYGIELNINSANITDPVKPQEMILDIPEFSLKTEAPKVLDLISRFKSIAPQAAGIIRNLGSTELVAGLRSTTSEGELKGYIKAAPGTIDIDTRFSGLRSSSPKADGHIILDSFSGATLMAGMDNALADLGNITADITYDLSLGSKIPQGSLKAEIADIIYREHHFTDISARASADGNTYSGNITVDNPGVMLDLDANATIEGPMKHLYLNLAARDIEPALFNIDPSHPERRFSIYCIGELSGPDIDHITGQIDIDDLSYGAGQQTVYLQDLDFELTEDNGTRRVTLNSDLMDGVIEGDYRLSALPGLCKGLMAGVLPALTGARITPDSEPALAADSTYSDILFYNFTLKNTSPIEPMVKLPVKVIYPISLTGGINSTERTMNLKVDAPYLQQGNKLIENTALSVKVNGATGYDPVSHGEVRLSTMMPTKNGPLTILTSAFAQDNKVDTRLQWKVARDRDFSGDIGISAAFDRDEKHNLLTQLNVNPGRMVFNDTVWTVEPSVINIEGNRAEIRDFRVGRDTQFVTIEGTASPDPADSITLTLEDVNLDYVFETLDISTAMFGGQATGKFYATELFSSHPRAYTDGLKVKNLTYNHSLMGNAFIKSSWQPETKAITLDADISQPNGRHSFINGNIKPMADSLDLSFDADRIQIGFLLPFMQAFASDISGYASGKARLYGSFKLIDMVGDVYGEDVKLSLGFTNTTYSTTDSIHFRPGRIDIPGITIRDIYGNTAKVNGWVTHECFKSPRFDFRVTDANNLLVYDVKESSDTRWFGHIFGNGTASITGEPGLVEIGAKITTMANSSFTFVLSDELDAQEYKFITFRDRDQHLKDSIAQLNAPPLIVQELKARMASQNIEGPPSVYRINLTVDVTPQAQVNLVMDPVGGDRIRAYGSGNMSMGYDSANEELRLNGTYTVERGKYNFTLQDIIIKEFNIKNGSSISFNGDPYAAQLDIAATYSVNANLSDLDESFLADKDLNRTNVPVNALLIVRGDMRQPDISFDLEFPTLTQDTYRKVRSIVNTNEMMNRQIIYLLALNRFYTPEYMTATKGNELVSVASSTISSQLSSMLGQLSDKWSLAPNFRSDRGDFSDVEVDLALSSHLLNNRLLLNGNFGYRDKALNNNSFIGDFDIEYLLNRRGTIRLKAYNRYNDQNYYVKTALTTQGVGIMFKRDFDNMFSFLRPLRREITDTARTDSAKVSHPADTVTAR